MLIVQGNTLACSDITAKHRLRNRKNRLILPLGNAELLGEDALRDVDVEYLVRYRACVY